MDLYAQNINQSINNYLNKLVVDCVGGQDSRFAQQVLIIFTGES